jgi:hypothetical protein
VQEDGKYRMGMGHEFHELSWVDPNIKNSIQVALP